MSEAPGTAGDGSASGPSAQATVRDPSPPPAEQGERKRPLLGVALRAAATIAILAFILSRLDLAEVGAAMLQTGLMLWLATHISHGLLHVMAALKWRRLMNACGLSVEPVDAIRAHFAGLFANTILPSIIGGDAVRMGIVVRDGSRLTAAATAVVADRATDVVALIALAAIGGYFVALEHVAVQILFYATTTLLLGIGVGVVGIRVVDAERLPGRAAKAVVGLQQAVEDLSQRKLAVAQALVVSLVMQGSFAAQNVMLGNAIGIDVPAAAWFVAWPLAKLVALTPVSLGGLGVREGAVVALLLPFGAEPALAMAEALIWYSLMLVLGLDGGAFSLWLGRRREGGDARA